MENHEQTFNIKGKFTGVTKFNVHTRRRLVVYYDFICAKCLWMQLYCVGAGCEIVVSDHNLYSQIFDIAAKLTSLQLEGYT